jgi:hypothetical protein
VAAFGFFIVKLNVSANTADGATLHQLTAVSAGAFAAVAARCVGLAMVVIGVAIIARSSAGNLTFEIRFCPYL